MFPRIGSSLMSGPSRRLTARAAVRVPRRSLGLQPASARFAGALATQATAGSSQGKQWNSWWALPAAVTTGVALGAALNQSEKSRMTADACGIVGFVGKEPAIEYLLEGITILQNRGYDSAGVVTLRDDGDGKFSLQSTKYASRDATNDSVELLKAKAPARHAGDSTGIAHTRWATHGGKTDANAHPHLDWKNRVALIHNGTIENMMPLKEELLKLGIPFRSETDTEVIVNMIGRYLDEQTARGEKPDVMAALKTTLTRLEGTWGLALTDNIVPGRIIAARNGSPLIVGVDEAGGRMFIASEHTAFGRYTNQYIPLQDGEVAEITAEGVSLDMSRTQTAPAVDIVLSPDPWPHWTIREIMEQPEALARALNYGARLDPGNLVKLGGLDANAERLLEVRDLLISACGTSLFAGHYGARLMRYLNAFDTVTVQDAAEVDADSFPGQRISRRGNIADTAGLLVISQSGETKDVMRAVDLGGEMGVTRLSVVNSVGSLIARTTGCGVYVHAGREHAVASTKAFVTQVCCLALVAGWFGQNREAAGSAADGDSPPHHHTTMGDRRSELVNAIHRLPTYCGMTLRTRDQCRRIAERIQDQEHLFVLGKGFAEPIAHEGALKIKEITYIHAEGYSGGALKHGPFALIEDGTPIIMLILDDQHAALMRIAAEEVLARGANVIVITDRPALVDGLKNLDPDNVLAIPKNGPLTALLGAVPLQLLAYELAVLRGINPDVPRNLAKAVTVD